MVEWPQRPAKAQGTTREKRLGTAAWQARRCWAAFSRRGPKESLGKVERPAGHQPGLGEPHWQQRQKEDLQPSQGKPG